MTRVFSKRHLIVDSEDLSRSIQTGDASVAVSMVGASDWLPSPPTANFTMSASCTLRHTLFSRRFAGGFSNSLLCVSRSKPLGQPLASKPLISRTWSTKAFLNVKDVSKLSLAENQRVKGFGILQFAQSKYRRATHQDHRVPRYSAGGPGGRPKVSWIESIPPPFIFWGILAINVGVFIAWYSAESTYVRILYTSLWTTGADLLSILQKVMRDSKPYIWMQQNFTTSMDNVKSGRMSVVYTDTTRT